MTAKSEQRRIFVSSEICSADFHENLIDTAVEFYFPAKNNEVRV